MPKKYRIEDLQLLLEELSKFTGESLDHYGLGRISDRIAGSIGHKYLYDRLLQPVRKADNLNAEVFMSPNKIDEIVAFLGYSNFDDFINVKKNPVRNELKHVEGNYYSFVRKNAIEGVLLQSPVCISEYENDIIWKLKGPSYEYHGSVKYTHNCMTCLMTSAQTGKTFYHVYKLGKILQPSVLMGIFSGISSAGDPIGGRCVLIKQDVLFDELTNRTILVNDIIESEETDQLKLCEFFSRFEDNNLRINNPYGFDMDDLVYPEKK